MRLSKCLPTVAMPVATWRVSTRMVVGRLLRGYNRLLLEKPMSTNMISGGVLGFIGDQIAEQALPDIQKDPARTAAVTGFGFFYQGYVSRLVYNMYDTLLPKRILKNSLKAGVVKALLDNFVHATVLYTPAFFIFTACTTKLWRGEWTDGDAWGLQSCKKNWWPTCVACWAMWIPVQFTTFALVPIHLQVLYVNSWCVAWSGTLSFLFFHFQSVMLHFEFQFQNS